MVRHDVFVGMRLHSFVAAYRVYTPAIISVTSRSLPNSRGRLAWRGLIFVPTRYIRFGRSDKMIRKAYDTWTRLQVEAFADCDHMKHSLLDYAPRVEKHVRLSRD